VLKAEECGEVVQFSFQRRFLGGVLGQVQSFLVDGLLIDTGPAKCGRKMLKICRQYRLTQIVNTHHHADHIGNNAILQREFSLPVRAQREALPIIRQPQENLRLNFYQRLVWGVPAAAKARRIGSQLSTPRYSFRILPTPGHCPDHICLYEEKQGWLFAGDLLRPESTSRAEQFWPGEDEAGRYNSLKRVAQLDLTKIFSASMGIVDDPGPLIRQQLERCEKELADGEAANSYSQVKFN
jgi:glyoxylase-like metal-dependent hydrolase (beta-lactamase superfamily II)